MKRYITLILLAFILTSAISGGVSYGQVNPGSNWEMNPAPEKSGWNLSKLNKMKEFIVDSTFVTGMMIVQDGKIVFQYGDIKENSYIASCRKSVLAMLYGKHIKNGEIDPNKTLDDLKIDDIGGLLPIEKQATIRDILAARSGVFHQASYPGDYLAYAPKRGTVNPGDYWLYSNWDFNVAGYIFEKATQTNIYDALERELVKPLQMQDWDRSLQIKEGDSTKSKYLAYPMWFSTRDMARIGWLMYNKGLWNSNQVIEKDWVAEMVKPRTDYIEVNKNIPSFRGAPVAFGYGYYWWLWQNNPDKRFDGGYSALGAVGQAISVFPAINAVVVFKTKEDYERDTPYPARFRLQTLAVESFDGKTK
ncbi:MAG: serine hydrolase [Bacteroidota bacterium]